MKILWVSPTPSHPQNAGNRAHIYAIGKEILNAGHNVTFLLYGQEQIDEEAMSEMLAFWPHFVYIQHLLRDRKRTKDEHWGIDDWFNVDLESAVRFLHNQNNYDIAYCEYVFFSKALSILPENVFKILNCHDRMSDRAELLETLGIPPDFFYTTPDQEKIALGRADLIMAIQKEECEFFQRLTKKTVIAVGYPIDTIFLPPRRFENVLRVGYLASNNSINRKSFANFMTAMRSNSELSVNIQLFIAGAICNSVEDAEDIMLTRLGIIADERELYREVDLVIIPMINATGMSIKTLSAIRHGMPFIATISGSRGIQVRLPEHKCESIEELIQYIGRIIRDPETELSKLRNESQYLANAYQELNRLQISNLLYAITTKSVYALRQKRVLVVTDIPFWEAGVGSHSRILAMCREIKKHYDLTVFFYGSLFKDREKLIDKAGFAGMVVSYKGFEKDASAITLQSTCPNLPGLKKWRHEIFFRSLRLFLDRTKNRFDAIIFEYIWLAYARDALPYSSVLTILDIHDIMSYRQYRYEHEQMLPHPISISLKEEIQLIERFHAVIAIQYEEFNLLESILKKTVPICCPHAIACEERPYSAVPTNHLNLGFLGADSDGNFEAIDWFIRQVWPIIFKLPVRLHVFGRICQRLKEVPEGIELHGVLNDLSLAYQNCNVMINPVIHGGGLKIKSIEALAYGKPLISSPEGAVGIREPEHSGIIVARNRTEFVNAILTLLHNPNLITSMGITAQKAATEQFSPQVCYEPLIEMIEMIEMIP